MSTPTPRPGLLPGLSDRALMFIVLACAAVALIAIAIGLALSITPPMTPIDLPLTR